VRSRFGSRLCGRKASAPRLTPSAAAGMARRTSSLLLPLALVAALPVLLGRWPAFCGAPARAAAGPPRAAGAAALPPGAEQVVAAIPDASSVIVADASEVIPLLSFISSIFLGITGYSIYTAFGPPSEDLRDPFEEHDD
ncbi:unnamed protein product, partial [Prorocentrum cordatum]